MKNCLFIHVGWAVIAIAAFLIGSQRYPQPAEVEYELGSTDSGAGGTSGAGPRISGPGRGGAGQKGAPSGRGQQPVDLAALAAEAIGDRSPLRRTIAFASLLEHVTAENAEEIFEALKAGRASREQIAVFFYTWGIRAGEGALESALDGIDGEMRHYVQGRMIAGWASTDSQAAIAWLQNYDYSGVDDAERLARMLNEGVIIGLMSEGADVTSEYLLGLVEEGKSEEAEGHFRQLASQQLQRLGFDAALIWGESLPPGEAKGAALDSIVHDFSKRDPLAASAWAERYASEDWAAAAVSRVAEDWAEEDPVASTGWLESLPQGAARNLASYTAFREWVRRDSTASSSYILEMEPSPARDHAVKALSETIVCSDPEAAVRWAGEIADPKMRTSVLERTARWWSGRDADAARRWLETSDLPQEVRESLLR